VSAYVELRAHTCFSFSDGAVSAEALAKHARARGYTHLGITDTADLGGMARFATKRCRRSRIRSAQTPNARR
jgi:DNA polymerase III, alpha subunit